MSRREDGSRELVLLKDDQRYVFTCAPGQETALLERLRQMARDPESDIEWFDAALISHQLGAQLTTRLGEQLHRFTRTDSKSDGKPSETPDAPKE